MTPLEQMKQMAKAENERFKRTFREFENVGGDHRSLSRKRIYAERRERIEKALKGRTIDFGALCRDFEISSSAAHRLLGEIGATKIRHGVYQCQDQ